MISPVLYWRVLFTLFLFGHSLCVDITKEVFGDIPTQQYLPAAFGDFNADKLTDIFVIEKTSDDKYLVKVLMSHGISPYLRESGPQCKFDRKILSVVPSDFDGDGAMDVLVISLKDKLYECYVLWGDLIKMECPQKFVSKATMKSQPLLMDYNGDMIADLFGEDAFGNRTFWVFPPDRTDPTQVSVEDLLKERTNDEPIQLSPLEMSGGHAFVDVDKDLAADLWVSAKGHFELWPNRDDFQSYETIEYPFIKSSSAFPKVVGQSTFLDIDLDGDMEVILPVCTDTACSESFIYVHEFANVSSDKWYDLKVNLKDADEVTWNFPSQKESYLYTNTITLRVGDMNLDGYPDLLVTLFNGDTPKVVPMINSPCHTDCQYPRSFVPQWKTFDAWSNTVLGTFFDFHEDGTLDVLLVNSSSDKMTYSISVYKDSVQYDATFVKVVVLTGVCYNDCPHHTIPYGTNQPGPSVTYEMTATDGGVRRACASQLSQSSHFALQLPFVMLGLGMNWNFVDKLTIGIPTPRRMPEDFPVIRNGSLVDMRLFNYPLINLHRLLSTTFTQIIPNSQLVVIPYPKDLPSRWITKLFITPSKAMLMTAGALIATCLFVSAIIGVLHLKEKKQDKREKRQQAQRFHFDAM